MRAPLDLLARSLTIAALVSGALIGCGRTDLNGYHPIQKTSIDTHNQGPAVDGVAPGAVLLSSTDTLNSSPIESDSASSLEELPVSALAPLNVVDGAEMSALLKLTPNPSERPATADRSDGKSAVSDKPQVAEVLVPDKTFQVDGQSKALRVTYDDLDLLKVLNLEPVTENAVDMMPDWLKHLSGQRIKIRGFMYPTYEAEGIERFVLARDNQICCFGRDPKVYDLVQVDMKRGKTTNYIPPTRSFDVVGRFKIEMGFEDGKPYGLYYIEDAQVVDR